MTADPQKTYALVVGVEKYAAGSKWNLDGPASDASKFVKWLRGRRVPNENIYLYLSSLDTNAAMAGPEAQVATRENIYQALTNILPSKKEGTLLYLFWGGHGMITPDNRRLLYYADATQQNILNLDLNSLLTSLRSNYFSGFEQQIFFIDACANYVVNWRLYGTLPHETFPSGDPLAAREQFVCLAARPGEYAKNVTEQQTGLFSQVVREELAKQGPDLWPPDMEALSTSLSACFSKLRAEGGVEQTPTHFWYKNWDGSERSIDRVPTASTSESWSPPPPPHAVERKNELDSVKSDLLSDEAMPITGGRRIALVGMGGAGKTVLAAQLARDQDVQGKFPDGVWWLTLDGRRLEQLQSQLASALGDAGQDFADWVRGRERLSKLLVDRTCLLVLDNVQQAAELDAFDALGPRGRLLFTTRDAGLAIGYAASVCHIDLLPVERSRELLANWAGLNVNVLPPEANRILDCCGGLPLAIAMAGAMVRNHPERWPSLLQKLTRADIDRIAAWLPGYPHPNLLAALDVSVEDLDTAGQERGLSAALDRYVDLAVFKGRGMVPESALAALWASTDGDETMVEDYLELFVDRSLAIRDAGGRLGLHDLQMANIFSRARGQLHLQHNRLVGGYARRSTDGWASVPDDGFFFQHLPQLLSTVGRIDELHALLTDAAWIRAKLSAAGVASLIADYALIPDDASLRLIGEALRLSARALAHDPKLLEGQLLGRLVGQDDSVIQSLLDGASRSRTGAWLRPLTRSLTQPGGLLRRVLPLRLRGAAIALEGGTGVAISGDGRIAVCQALDFNPRLLVWDLQSLEEPRELRPPHPWGHLTITGDGRLAAFATGPWHVEIVDLLSGTVVDQTITKLNPTAIAMADNPLRVVVGHLDGWVACWEPGSGSVQTVKVFKDNASIRAVAISTDGNMAVVMSNYGGLIRLSLPGLHPAQSFGYHDGAFDLALSPDGCLAVTGGHDRSLILWDLDHGQPGQPAQVLPPQDSRISTVSVIDGNRAITSLENGTIQVWNLTNGQLLASVELDDDIRHLAVSRDGRIAIVKLGRERAVVLDLTALNVGLSMTGQGRPWAVAATPDGRMAFAGSTRGTLTRFDIPPELDPSGVRSRIVATCTFRGDGRLSFSGDWLGSVTVMDVTYQPPREYLWPSQERIQRLGVTPDGQRVAWGSSDRRVTIWEGANHPPHSVSWGGGSAITSIVITPTGQVVVVRNSGTISYGDVEHDLWGQWEAPLNQPSRIQCAAAPDEQSRVLGMQDGSFILEGRNGAKLRVAVHQSSVETLAVTLVGAVIVSGADDGSVAVWQPHLSAPPRVVPGHTDPVKVIAVAPDGTFAVSGSTADDLVLWALPELTPVATFQCDGRIADVALAASASLVVVADSAGSVHLLVPVYRSEAV